MQLMARCPHRAIKRFDGASSKSLVAAAARFPAIACRGRQSHIALTAAKDALAWGSRTAPAPDFPYFGGWRRIAPRRICQGIQCRRCRDFPYTNQITESLIWSTGR
jgi:hypothetical protein